MIRISVSEPKDESWKRWRRDCATATKALVKSHAKGRPTGVTKLYARKKAFFKALKGPFRGKCAYCETRFAENHAGDLDHFRPKGRLDEEVNGKRVQVFISGPGGVQVAHPGYYWLAYEWRNLLPTCNDCNRPNGGNTEDGRCAGKLCWFPVNGFRAVRPGEEARERPLLINPTLCDIDPADHLTVDETGVMSAKNGSKKGKACLAVFALNERTALVEGRRAAYAAADNAVQAWFNALASGNPVRAKEIYRQITTWLDGSAPFASAGRAALRAKRPLFRQVADLEQSI